MQKKKKISQSKEMKKGLSEKVVDEEDWLHQTIFHTKSTTHGKMKESSQTLTSQVNYVCENITRKQTISTNKGL